MLLAIDAGNTRIKYSVFESDTLLESGFFAHEDLRQKVAQLLKDNKEISNLLVVSVGSVSNADFEPFKDINVRLITNQDAFFPFSNQYKTPKTVGTDRLVLAAGAVIQFPKQNRLIIDAGTCITYDFVNADDQYLGGAISPGMRLRYESLHHHTAKLPLLSPEEPLDFIGGSTHESIHSGIVNGIVHEIDGFISVYAQRYSNFIIILTGGDTVFLSNRLKNTIFANSNFLLESLNHLFHHKINK